MKFKKLGILLCAAMLAGTAGTSVQAKNAGDYKDVKPGDWFYPYVEDVSEAEYMTGKSPTVFAPLDNLTRAQLATVIYRIHEKPDTAYESRFPDVPNGTFYSVPVTWANTYGVITGYANGKFGPDEDITREQLATMLYRYAVKLGYDTSESGDLSAFPDAGNVSDFAKEAMEWANGAAIITGDSGKLNPQGKVNRAVGATMISRFTNLVGTSSKPAHQHEWKANYKTVTTKAAWDETVTVKAAWSEQVLVKDAWSEQVCVREAQTITTSYDLCSCGHAMYSDAEIQAHAIWGLQNPAAAAACAGGRDCKTKTETIPAEYQTVNHPAEYKTVNHPAETKTVHHDAETKQELVNHTCTKCGAVK